MFQNIMEINKLLKPLGLNDVKYLIAFDLKCSCSLFGLSSHSGKYACHWYEGESILKVGEKRTLGLIDINYNKFVADGCKSNYIKEFKNCISPGIVIHNSWRNTTFTNNSGTPYSSPKVIHFHNYN